jgi:hypothetical protein
MCETFRDTPYDHKVTHLKMIHDTCCVVPRAPSRGVVDMSVGDVGHRLNGTGMSWLCSVGIHLD